MVRCPRSPSRWPIGYARWCTRRCWPPTRGSATSSSWLIDTPQDAAKAEQFRALAARRGTDYHPVWLTCDEDELRRRVELPDRLVRNKLRDPSMVAEAVGRGVAGAPDDALRIDTSSITAGETADRIAAWISDRGAC